MLLILLLGFISKNHPVLSSWIFIYYRDCVEHEKWAAIREQIENNKVLKAQGAISFLMSRTSLPSH